MSSDTRSTLIYWFRNDLRLHDNAGLQQACTEADVVIPVYIFDLRSFDELPDIKVPKAGIHRTRFLLESLQDLRQSLRAQGSDLLIRTGNPADVLAELVSQHNAKAVYAGQEATPEETQLEVSVRQRLEPAQAELKLVWMLSLYHPDDLPFATADVPDAYRDFRRTCERQSAVRQEVPSPNLMPLPQSVERGQLPTLQSLGFDSVETDPRAAIQHVGGETVALQRMTDYF